MMRVVLLHCFYSQVTGKCLVVRLHHFYSGKCVVYVNPFWLYHVSILYYIFYISWMQDFQLIKILTD